MTDKTHIEFDGLGFSPAITEQGLAAWKSMQQELLEFMGRRAQACAKWTSDVSRCRTPQDLWHEQLRFVKEMVSEPNRRWVTPLGDDEAYTAVLAQLCENRGDRVRLGQANREKCLRDYDLLNMIQAYLNLYSEALQV